MPRYNPDGELEPGERVANCLLMEEPGAACSKLEDRAWPAVLNLYGYMLVQASDYAAPWKPRFDERGRWLCP